MNEKKYNQIVDKAYKNYINKRCKDCNKDNYKESINGGKVIRPFAKEEFIDKCKTHNEFSEYWGLKIEDRELSLDERNELLNKVLNRNHKRKDCFSDKEFETETLKDATAFNIPTRLISLTYNNETIEIYE